MRPDSLLRYSAAAFLVLVSPLFSMAEDWTTRLHPYLSLEQKYDDNLNMTHDNRIHDYITVARPGLSFSNMDQTGGISFDYNAGWNQYWDHTDFNYWSHNGVLDAKYMTREHFNFYLKEIFIRSDEPREREYLAPSEIPNAYYISTVQERSIYWRNIVTPTVEYMFGRENKLGVSYTENDYENQNETIGKRREASVNPYFELWLDQRNGISGRYGYTHDDNDNTSDMRGQNASLRYTNRYGPQSSVYLDNMVLRRDFKGSDSSDYDIYNPKIGINHAFTKTLSGQIEGGYYWQDQKNGPTRSAPTYQAGLTSSDQQTIYNITFQGGYYEDYATAQNLGFTRYHRLLVSVNHRPERRMFVSLSGNCEYADFTSDRNDWVYGGSVGAGYDIMKWLTVSLNYSYQQRNSNIDANDYDVNRVMFTIKATY